MSVKPFSPHDVVQAQIGSVPDGAITALNEHLTRIYSPNRTAKVLYREMQVMLKTAMEQSMAEEASAMISHSHVQALADVFRRQGWVITYHTPDCEQNFDPFFDFKANV
jgi:hypothetical protein